MGESRITPSGIINDAVSMIGKMNDSSFPIDVFPNKIRNIILNMYEYLAFPIDYTVWGIERSVFFNGREKWAKGFENQRV